MQTLPDSTDRSINLPPEVADLYFQHRFEPEVEDIAHELMYRLADEVLNATFVDDSWNIIIIQTSILTYHADSPWIRELFSKSLLDCLYVQYEGDCQSRCQMILNYLKGLADRYPNEASVVQAYETSVQYAF